MPNPLPFSKMILFISIELECNMDKIGFSKIEISNVSIFSFL